MNLTLQHSNECPNWEQVEAHLSALANERADLHITLQLIETQEAAVNLGFRGSPTVLIEGEDPFADPEAPVGLSCRVYLTPEGLAGTPTLAQLRAAVIAAG